jgi:hypothetical protein
MGKRDEKVAKDGKPIYKKWWFWLIVIFLFAGLANSLTTKNDKKTASSESIELKKETKSDDTVKAVNTSQKAEFIVLAEAQIKKAYQIDNFKIDTSENNLKVNIFPDNKSSDGKTTYKNILNGAGEFTYRDKVYKFSFMYSKINSDSYKTLYLYSDYDKNKGIDVPLKN